MAKKKIALPTNESIESKKDAFKELMEKIASGELDITNKKQTATDKLMLVKDELLLLKDKNIPYAIIAKILEENLDLKVSEQTLRAFCQNRLGFPKKQRTTKSAKKVLDGDVVEKSEKSVGYDASKDLAGDNVKFD
ncbi:hypothetical protein I3256_18790 [Photobacterium damselae]|uniref:hypothetical protein n=1 Tax=Photobacterium damselae TaxID=38293 RepID=UPI001EDDB952|nr:hypothetical protein [Photobacterium damselae]MCG3817991.1 hypothetical protein [Photobacterium damselae]